DTRGRAVSFTDRNPGFKYCYWGFGHSGAPGRNAASTQATLSGQSRPARNETLQEPALRATFRRDSLSGRAGRAPTAPDPADPKASPSLIGLVEELQRVMPACWNLALVLTQEIFGIHVKGAGDILRRANGLYKESRPAFQVHL